MSQTRLIILIALALTIGAFLLADKLDTKRAVLHETLEINYATFAKKRDFILRTVKAGPEMKASLTDLEHIESNIIAKTDPSLAFALLQGKVQDMAQATGMKLYAIKQLPTVAHKGYTSLPLYVDMRGTIETFSEFLRFLGSTGDFIGIENISVTSSSQGTLRVRVQLAGLMKS